MLDPIANLLTLTISVLFPVYASYKALLTADPALLHPWLTYWLVLALANTALGIASFILPYLPFYAWLRLGMHLYLLLPGETQGATYVYRTHILPILVDHDKQIDEFIATAHDRAKAVGLDYWRRLVEFVKAQLLGESGATHSQYQSSLPRPIVSPHPSSSSLPHQQPPKQSYTQTLLSRFNLPGVRPEPPSMAHPADIYSLVSSALQAASAYSSTPSSNPDSNPHRTPPPPPSAGTTPAERLTYITAQTERLRTLLGIFDQHARDLAAEPDQHAPIPSPERMPGTLADSQVLEAEGSGITKSRSEVEFEAIDHRDLHAAPSAEMGKGEAAGWGAWLWVGKAPKGAATRRISSSSQK